LIELKSGSAARLSVFYLRLAMNDIHCVPLAHHLAKDDLHLDQAAREKAIMEVGQGKSPIFAK
jgi:hypothetical protein